MLKSLKKFFKSVVRINITSKFMANHNPGGRIYPARTKKNDAASQFRLDAGLLLHKRFRQINLQVNEEAKDEGLRNWVKKHGTHAKLASAVFDTATKDPEQEGKRVLQELETKGGRNL